MGLLSIHFHLSPVIIVHLPVSTKIAVTVIRHLILADLVLGHAIITNWTVSDESEHFGGLHTDLRACRLEIGKCRARTAARFAPAQSACR
jgi:hypothetical protein